MASSCSRIIARALMLTLEVRRSSVLSPGEIQRLGFARLLYDPPAFAVLDESTSSLPEDTEASLYRSCIAAGITLISVGHRSTLRRFHRQLLELDGDGNWRLSELPW